MLKVEPDLAPPAVSSPLSPHTCPVSSPRYPSCTCAPPKHLYDFHVYTTMADDSSHPDLTYPYINAAGHEVDLAIQNDVMMAHVYHYIMFLTADKLYTAPPFTKKKMA